MRKILSLFLCSWMAVWVFAYDTLRINNPATWTVSELSKYSGQTMVFATPMYVVSNNGGYYVSPRRIFTPTNIAYPSECSYYSSLNKNGKVYISGISGYHRTGEMIYNMVAKISSSSLTFKSGDWKGNSRADLQANVPSVDIRGEHTLLVCAMNLEYYLTDFSSYHDRGPRSLAEHQKQRTKISKALAKINADIYGFVEVQKGDGALKEIADDLTKNTGRNFTYVKGTDAVSGTYTKSGYVYCTDVVETASALQGIDAIVKDRKMMMVFMEKATMERFIFSLNHFKAKSGGTSTDCQGAYNEERVQEANAVVTKYNKFKNAIKEENILVMGDLNAYAYEDPIEVFRDAHFIDLHNAFYAKQSYSYTYNNEAGYLDHALCDSSMYQQVTGMAVYHINSDELDKYTYESGDTTMFRCSDHDPVLVGLKLRPNPTTEVGINAMKIYYGSDIIEVSNAARFSEESYIRIYSVDGHLMQEQKLDHPIYPTEDDTDIQYVDSPLHSGVYIVEIYRYDADGKGRVKHFKIIVP